MMMMLQLEHLSRADMGSVLECRGSNNNHTQPVTATIRIDMNCEYYTYLGDCIKIECGW